MKRARGAAGAAVGAAALLAGCTHPAPLMDKMAGPSYLVAPGDCGPMPTPAGPPPPVLCPDGRPRLAADQYLRSLNLLVLTLGPGARQADVQGSMCADAALLHPGKATEISALLLAAAEQRWSFTFDPDGVLGHCGDSSLVSGVVTVYMVPSPGTVGIHSPDPVQVKRGQSVMWTNTDVGVHTASQVATPGFDSGFLLQGQSYTSGPFYNPGTIPYHCNVHSTMAGTIVVSP